MGIFNFFGSKKRGKERQEQQRIQLKQKLYAGNGPSQQSPIVQNSNIQEDTRTTFYELENIKNISMGGGLVLSPYDAQAYFSYPDASVLPMIANSYKIKRFLPGLGFVNEEATRKQLKSYMLKTEAQLGITYVIRSSNMPVGMVFVNTPLYNKNTINLAIWTVDFYISEILEHQGVMFNSLARILNELKQSMGVKKVYAIVDSDNEESKRVLGKGLFNLIDSAGFIDVKNPQKTPLVYMLDLSTIRFERG